MSVSYNATSSLGRLEKTKIVYFNLKNALVLVVVVNLEVAGLAPDAKILSKR
jgi:hypothetical protein